MIDIVHIYGELNRVEPQRSCHDKQSAQEELKLYETTTSTYLITKLVNRPTHLT